MTDWTDEKYVEVWVRLMGDRWTGSDGDKIRHEYLVQATDTNAMWLKRENYRADDGVFLNSVLAIINPLADWNQCMMLVEKMEADGWTWKLHSPKPKMCQYQYKFFIEKDLLFFEANDMSATGSAIRACAAAKGVE